MALMILVSTTSFTVYQHYCGDEITDVAVFKHAEGCGMETAVVEIPEKTCHTPKKSCCNDRVVLVEGQGRINPASQVLSVEHQVFLAAVIYSFDYLFFEPSENVQEAFHYYPPPIAQDITILHQVFLI